MQQIDRETFSRIVKGWVESRESATRELARHMEVAPSTVTAWSSGVSSPHPILREIIVRWIRLQK